MAQNKIEIARRLGADLEPGWLAAEDGTPIMEEVPVPATYHLLPVGATRELGSHKGYGLACVVDILAGVLTGFGYGAVPGRPNFGHYVAAYNVAGFDDPDHFKDEMDGWLQMMKSTKPAPGPRPGSWWPASPRPRWKPSAVRKASLSTRTWCSSSATPARKLSVRCMF